MKKIEIYEFQLKTIQEALRLTIRINECSDKKTCFDRQVMQAKGFTDNALDNKIDNEVKYM